MEEKKIISKADFIEAFNELNPDNQKYIIAIQRALAFAQSSSQDTENNPMGNNCEGIKP